MKKIIIAMVAQFFEFIQNGVDVASLIDDMRNGTTGLFSTATSSSAGKIFSLVEGLAMGLAIIYFCYEANSKWAFEGADISPKSLAAPFLKLIMAVIIIENCQNWLNVAWNSMIDMIDQLGLVSESGKAVANGIAFSKEPQIVAENLVKNMGTLELVGFLIVALIGWIVGTIVTLLFKYKILMYKIEFAFRIGVSPLAMADAYNGMGSNSVRWFKGIIGFSLYGVAIIFVPTIASKVIGGMTFFDGMNAEKAINELVALSEKKEKLRELGALKVFGYALPGILCPIASLGVLGAIQQVCREAAT